MSKAESALLFRLACTQEKRPLSKGQRQRYRRLLAKLNGARDDADLSTPFTNPADEPIGQEED